jgi:hypothetical protein
MKLSTIEVVRLVPSLRIPGAWALLLESLGDAVSVDATAPHAWHALRLLSKEWEPEVLKSLATTYAAMTSSGIDLADVIVQHFTNSAAGVDPDQLGDSDSCRALLRLLAKCRAQHAGRQISQLLSRVGWSLDLDVCDFLWLEGDTRAEAAILASLESITDDDDVSSLRQAYRVRALATCGTNQSREPIMAALRSGLFPVGFEYEAIEPLVAREILTWQDVGDVVVDTSAGLSGRIACLNALFENQATQLPEVLETCTADDNPIPLRSHAVVLIGLSQGAEATGKLLGILRTAKSDQLASAASQSLARLDATSALVDVERALRRFPEHPHTDELVLSAGTLAGNQMKELFLRFLLDHRLGGEVTPFIVAQLARFWSDEEARSQILALLAAPGPEMQMYGHIAIAGLIDCGHDGAREFLAELFVEDRLTESERQVVASRLGNLVDDDQEWKALSAELLVDRSMRIRQMAAKALAHVDEGIRREIYLLARDSNDVGHQARAVEALGFWDGSSPAILSELNAQDVEVRRAARAAHERYSRREWIRELANDFGEEEDNLGRAAAYYALVDTRDEYAIECVRHSVRPKSRAAWFASQLIESVQAGAEKALKELEDAEVRFESEPGTVRFP